VAYSVVGKRVPRVDAPGKATGSTKFAADIRLNGMLWGKMVRSPLPHARLLFVDISRAERLPGVRAVVTAADLCDARFGSSLMDWPSLACDKVRFVGDAVAAVAATDEETAAEAAELVRVEYEELPAVLDPEEAMREDTPIIHEDLLSYHASWPAIRHGNVCSETRIRRGDVERAFDEADEVFDDTFHVPVQVHGYIEPHAVVVTVEPPGKVIVWTCTQAPFVVRGVLSEALGLPMNRVRVIATPAGGGFGGKGKALLEPACAALARKAGRPVKMVMTREEEFLASTPRHSTTIHLRTAVTREGSILARQARLVFDTGAYAVDGPYATSSGCVHLAGLYRIPNLSVTGYCVYTNKIPRSSMRGPGAPQAFFAIESQMDIIAERLGVDPLELRLRNAWEDGDVSGTGQKLEGVRLKETLRAAAARANWGSPLPPGRGRGLACGYWQTTTMSSSAQIKINEDGTVILAVGTAEIGSGSLTSLVQIAAEELGVRIEDVTVLNGDTETTPFDALTGGSRITYNMGRAVQRAAQDARHQVFALAADRLNVRSDDLEARDGRVYVRGNPGRGIALAELSRIAHTTGGGPILGRGSYRRDRPPYDANSVEGGFSYSAPGIVFSAHVAEVEVDRETGQVHLCSLVAAQDVGFAINPLAVEGQVEGGAAQGIGQALYEEVLFSAGKPLNPNFTDYRIPTAVDLPRIETVIVESPTDGPYGAKGIAEATNVAAPAAIANAVAKAAGVRLREVPITPERVFAVIWRREQGEGTELAVPGPQMAQTA
jgi:CO/xanthine dehydrogenase Mo-binding subunit